MINISNIPHKINKGKSGCIRQDKKELQPRIDQMDMLLLGWWSNYNL